MQATANIEPKCRLYSYQAEAIYLLMFRNGCMNVTPGEGKANKVYARVDSSGLPAPVSDLSVDAGHAKFALWLTYKSIVVNKRPLSKTDLIHKLKEYNVEPSTVDTALKALVNVFEALNQFTYTNDKKCKPRYSTNNKDQDVIRSWCVNYEKANPEVGLLRNKLKLG
jgi:hypothetical protein